MNQSSKSMLAGLGLAIAMVVAPAAHAATDISHAPHVLNFLDGTTDFGAAFGKNQKDNFFADKFTFSISEPQMMESYLSSISSSAANGLTITDFTVRNTMGIVAHGVQESVGKIDLWSIYGVTLMPGSYFLQVDGRVNSNQSGSFGANVNLSPVPEPETWGMMLGGLSVLAALARRRQAKANA